MTTGTRILKLAAAAAVITIAASACAPTTNVAPSEPIRITQGVPDSTPTPAPTLEKPKTYGKYQTARELMKAADKHAGVSKKCWKKVNGSEYMRGEDSMHCPSVNGTQDVYYTFPDKDKGNYKPILDLEKAYADGSTCAGDGQAVVYGKRWIILMRNHSDAQAVAAGLDGKIFYEQNTECAGGGGGWGLPNPSDGNDSHRRWRRGRH